MSFFWPGMNGMKEIALEHADGAQAKYAHYYNLRSKDKIFSVGDQVVILEKDKNDKLGAGWRGPGIITKKVSPYSYLVQLPDGNVRTLHANYLRPFVARVSTVGLICEGEEDFGQIEYPTDTVVTKNRDWLKVLNEINLDH